MRTYTETALRNFNFWSGAQYLANSLTTDELDRVEEALEDIYPEGMDETTINDLFWFDREFVCELAGVEWDEETAEVIRTEE